MDTRVIALVGVAAVAVLPLPSWGVPGLLVAEQAQITSRICIYDAVGERFSLTVGLANVCPPTYDPDGAYGQSDRSALNAQIARGFESPVQGFMDSWNRQRQFEAQQRQAELDTEIKQLERERLRRELAANPVPVQVPVVSCIFPPGDNEKYVVPYLISIRRSAAGVAIKNGDEWEERPYIYRGNRLEFAGPPIRRGSGPDASLEPSTIVSDGDSVVLIPDAEQGIRFTGICLAEGL